MSIKDWLSCLQLKKFLIQLSVKPRLPISVYQIFYVVIYKNIITGCKQEIFSYTEKAKGLQKVGYDKASKQKKLYNMLILEQVVSS